MGGRDMMRTLFLTLPIEASGAPATRPWWLVVDGAVVKSGSDAGWIEEAVEATLVAIADPSRTRLIAIPEEARGNPQLTTKSLIETRSSALGADPHVVAGEEAIALVDRGAMTRWIDWATQQGATIDRLVPLAGLLPYAANWHRALVGDWAVLAKGRTVALDEPGLGEALTGGEPVEPWTASEVEEWLVNAATAPPYDFLGGRKRRRSVPLDRSVIKRMAAIAATVLLLLALAPLVELVRWNNEAARLDEDSAAMASEALGRPVTAEEAEGALRSERVSPNATPATMLAALTQAMQVAPSVRASRIDYGTGRLSVELVAPQPQALQQVVDALQRANWRLAAQPAVQDGGQARILLDMEAW